MFDINAKLETLRYKNFLEIKENIERPQYQLSIYYTKFLLKNYLTNFNIIPGCEDVHLPPLFSEINKVVKKIREIDKELEKNEKLQSSKYIYIWN